MSAEPRIYDEDELPAILDAKQVAALLGVNVWTVYDLAKRQELPGARKIGGSLRIHRNTLLEYIRTGRGE